MTDGWKPEDGAGYIPTEEGGCGRDKYNDLRELVEQWREEAEEYHEDGHHEAYNVSQRRGPRLTRPLVVTYSLYTWPRQKPLLFVFWFLNTPLGICLDKLDNTLFKALTPGDGVFPFLPLVVINLKLIFGHVVLFRGLAH